MVVTPINRWTEQEGDTTDYVYGGKIDIEKH